MNAYLSEESRAHYNEFELASALWELYRYLDNYWSQVVEAVEQDEWCRRQRIPAKLQQLRQLFNGAEQIV